MVAMQPINFNPIGLIVHSSKHPVVTLSRTTSGSDVRANKKSLTSNTIKALVENHPYFVYLAVQSQQNIPVNLAALYQVGRLFTG